MAGIATAGAKASTERVGLTSKLFFLNLKMLMRDLSRFRLTRLCERTSAK